MLSLLKPDEQKALILQGVEAIKSRAIILLNKQGDILTWNAGAKALYGYEAEEVLNKPITMFFSKDEGSPDEQIKSLLQNAISQCEYEERFYLNCKNNPSSWVSLLVRKIHSEADEFVCFMAITRQLSLLENKQIENNYEGLQGAYEKLNLILDTTHAGVWNWDVVNDQVFWEKSLDQLFGINGEKSPSSSREFFEKYIYPDDRDEAINKINAIISNINDTNYEVTHRVIWPDRSIRHVFSRGHIKRDAEGKALNVYGISLDVTAQKELQKERQEAQERRQLEEFVDTICHEIRNPLLGIYGVADQLNSEVENLAVLPDDLSNQEIKENIGVVVNKLKEAKNTLEQCAQQQKIIVDEVLDYSKLETHQMELQNKAFNIKEIADSVIQMYAIEMKRKGLSFQLELPEDNQWIKADPCRLKQVLTNLLSNAIKFTNHGCIKITMVVQFNITDNTRNLSCAVSDTGIGMTIDEMAKLFGRFVQMESSDKKRYSGSGLGLAITKKLVELMGGKIQVTSEKNKGSMFSFYIQCNALTPEEILEEKSRLTSKKHRVDQTATVTSKKILVVEDNAINQKLLEKILQKEGHKVAIVENGTKAVEKYQEEKFDIIFMDVEMPVMNGLDSTKAIRQIEKEKNFQYTPIIGLSGNARLEKVQQATEAGMDGYITKPYKNEEIKRYISEYTAEEVVEVVKKSRTNLSNEIVNYPKRLFSQPKNSLEEASFDTLTVAIKKFTDNAATLLGSKLIFALDCIDEKIKTQIRDIEFGSYVKGLILNDLKRHLSEVIDSWNIKGIQVKDDELFIEAFDKQQAQQIKKLLLDAGLKIHFEIDKQPVIVGQPQPH